MAGTMQGREVFAGGGGNKNQSISRAFMLSSLVFVVSLIVVLAFISTRMANEQLRAQMNTRGQAMVNYMAKTSVYYYRNFDLGALDGFVKEIVKTPDVTFAVYYDEKKKPVTISSAEPADKTDQLVFETAIKDDAENLLGYLSLGYSTRALRESALKSFLIMGMSTILALVIVIFGVSGLIRRLIVRPLRQAITVADRLSQGDLPAAVEIRKNDEIGHLLASMNAMIEKLRTVVITVKTTTDQVTSESRLAHTSSEHVARGATE